MVEGFKIVIIGGGLSGCLLANGLLQHGIDFDVYEAEPIKRPRPGYQIRLGSNALSGFNACLTDAQRERLYPLFGRSGGVLASAPILYTPELKQMLDLTKFPVHTKSAPINRAVLRTFLSRPLQQVGKIQYDKKFIDYRILRRDGRADGIEVEFEDGTKTKCDLLISAEGSVSSLNRIIGLDNIVQDESTYSFLAKGNLPPSKLLRLPSELQKGAITISKNGIILFYSAYMPDGIRRAETSGKSSKDAPLDYDASIASIFWSLSVPATQVPNQDASAIRHKLNFCLDQIKHWDPLVHEMLSAVENEDIHVLQPRSSKRPPDNWRLNVEDPADSRKGCSHVWLLGDAIHPMHPSRGMGGNQALRDCANILPAIITLAQKAKRSGLQEKDFHGAIAEYEGCMIPRAFKWVQSSDMAQRSIPDVSTFRGRLSIFFMARVLDMTYLFTLIRRCFGFQPHDDAPELPD